MSSTSSFFDCGLLTDATVIFRYHSYRSVPSAGRIRAGPVGLLLGLVPAAPRLQPGVPHRGRARHRRGLRLPLHGGRGAALGLHGGRGGGGGVVPHPRGRPLPHGGGALGLVQRPVPGAAPAPAAVRRRHGKLYRVTASIPGHLE